MEQTITIVNNSGKIISTGKQLFSIFKEAKASYSEKKESVKAERALHRSNTFNHHSSRSSHRAPSVRDDDAEFRPRTLSRAHTQYYADDDDYTLQDEPRRRSYDTASVASSRRSHRHKSSHSHSSRHHGGGHRERSSRAPSVTSVALTEDNLKTHSEAASSRPSRPPIALSRYRSPYAETVPMGQSNMDLTVVERGVYPVDTRQTSIVPRTKSESQLGALVPQPKKKKIDMNMAYGEIPPDLAERTDLAETDQGQATALVRKVEGLLDEANCVHHSAKAIIKHLQEKPEAAAAVALTLSELSAVAAKMSPAVLGLLKGGSPAVFSLLSSPHFLIASGLAVGVTVVMFGGWKIVKRVQEERAQQAAMTCQQLPPVDPMGRPVLQRSQTYAGSYDEALVLDDELSTIESWRRGIEPLNDDESADMELITPEADRATRADEHDRYEDQRDFDDARSHRSTRTHRTSKTSKTSKTTKTHKTHKSHHTSKRTDDDERRSSKGSSRDGPSSSSSKLKSRSEVKLLEDGRSSRHRSRDDVDLAIRPKAQRQESDLFKTLFKKKNKDASRSELVLA